VEGLYAGLASPLYPFHFYKSRVLSQSSVEVQEVDFDPQDRPILFDKTVIDALIGHCRRFGFRVPGELPPTLDSHITHGHDDEKEYLSKPMKPKPEQ
jgi:hypothetical protein